MEQIEKLLGAGAAELEKILSTKTVVGDPISISDATLIPLVSVGFCFGAGGGSGTQPGHAGQGTGGGTGGGGGVKPVAIVVVDKQGVRLESLKGSTTATLAEKVADLVAQGMRKEKEGR